MALKETKARKQLINHVHSMNNCITYAWLGEQSNAHLLSMAHPSNEAFHRDQLFEERKHGESNAPELVVAESGERRLPYTFET
jgi:hypothetical protein